jgi:ABC-type bacteriocin/lantibiotic exporter with double-glycine peptidase domain
MPPNVGHYQRSLEKCLASNALGQILLIAVVLEFLVLAAPLLNQLVVDEAIATHDADLLSVLILGFGLLLIQTVIAVARSWMLVVLGQAVSLQWAGNVFSHLIRLPTEYFKKDIWVTSFRDLGLLRPFRKHSPQAL